MKSFNFEQYWSMNFFSILNFKTLLDYINDEKALKVHINGFEYINEKGETITEQTEENKAVWYQMTKNDMTNTIELMNNQLIVFMSTIVESAIDEFFCCVFIKEPNRMLSLRDQETLGFSLKDFLKYSSREEYINEIASRAANYCNSGKITSVIKSINDVSGLIIEDSLVKVLYEISKLRNEIVHEGKHHEITYEKLKGFSNSIEIFLKVLSFKLNQLNINIIDPGNLLGLLEEIEYEGDFEEEE